MEMLAEAACLLMPGVQLVEMRDVRTYRWIALEAEAMTLEIEARQTAAGEVYAQIREADVKAPLIVEARLLFDRQCPQPPTAGPFAIEGARPSQWQSEAIYRSGMFHGPVFQGLLAMEQVGRDGAVATLTVKEPDHLFRTNPHPTFVTDPVLLDQPGQVVGLWTSEMLDQGYVIFPYYLDALKLYAVTPAGHARCHARIELVGDQQVTSDLDVIGDDGQVWMQLMGWKDRRFDLSRAFLNFIHSPQNQVLSQSWPALSTLLPEGCQLNRLSLTDFGADFFTAHGGIWQKVLAHLILSRSERLLWQSLRTPTRQRLEWLLGRMAGKDAVRTLVHKRFGLDLLPADIEILPDARGLPIVNGLWLKQIAQPLLLSISHSEGRAVALAASEAAYQGVGIDIEPLGRVSQAAAQVAFTRDEQKLLSTLPLTEWTTRFWCAKEATAKATGDGLNAGPHTFTAIDVDQASGVMRMLQTFPAVENSQERRVWSATTVCDDGWVAALSLMEKPDAGDLHNNNKDLNDFSKEL